ncbi:MAG: flagellar biosynthetic protein FliP, partial [Nitrosomonadales bacterium]
MGLMRHLSFAAGWVLVLALPQMAFAADAGFPALTSTPSPG